MLNHQPRKVLLFLFTCAFSSCESKPTQTKNALPNPKSHPNSQNSAENGPSGVIPGQTPLSHPAEPTTQPGGFLPLPQQPSEAVPTPLITRTPSVPIPSAVVPNVPVPTGVIPNPPIPTNPPPAVTVKNLWFPATCLANQASGYHVTDPGFIMRLNNATGQVVAAAPMSLDAISRGFACSTKDDEAACFVLNIALSFANTTQKDGTYNGKLSMCKAKDINVAPPSYECLDVGPNDQTSFGTSRVFQYLNLDVTYEVKKDTIEITNYENLRKEVEHRDRLLVYHPMFSFLNPDICEKDFTSPLVLDLNRNQQMDLSDVWEHARPPQFDMTGIGKKQKVGWIKNGDGFLTLGSNVKDGRDLFGEYSRVRGQPTTFGKTFEHGFAALAQYDDNHDGQISPSDQVWKDLFVWSDENFDGVAQQSEVQSLSALNIATISLNARILNNGAGLSVAGNKVMLTANFATKDNQVFPISDVWFDIRDGHELTINKKTKIQLEKK